MEQTPNIDYREAHAKVGDFFEAKAQVVRKILPETTDIIDFLKYRNDNDSVKVTVKGIIKNGDTQTHERNKGGEKREDTFTYDKLIVDIDGYGEAEMNATIFNAQARISGLKTNS